MHHFSNVWFNLAYRSWRKSRTVCLLWVLPALTNNFTYEIYYYIYYLLLLWYCFVYLNMASRFKRFYECYKMKWKCQGIFMWNYIATSIYHMLMKPHYSNQINCQSLGPSSRFHCTTQFHLSPFIWLHTI